MENHNSLVGTIENSHELPSPTCDDNSKFYYSDLPSKETHSPSVNCVDNNLYCKFTSIENENAFLNLFNKENIEDEHGYQSMKQIHDVYIYPKSLDAPVHNVYENLGTIEVEKAPRDNVYENLAAIEVEKAPRDNVYENFTAIEVEKNNNGKLQSNTTNANEYEIPKTLKPLLIIENANTKDKSINNNSSSSEEGYSLHDIENALNDKSIYNKFSNCWSNFNYYMSICYYKIRQCLMKSSDILCCEWFSILICKKKSYQKCTSRILLLIWIIFFTTIVCYIMTNGTQNNNKKNISSGAVELHRTASANFSFIDIFPSKEIMDSLEFHQYSRCFVYKINKINLNRDIEIENNIIYRDLYNLTDALLCNIVDNFDTSESCDNYWRLKCSGYVVDQYICIENEYNHLIANAYSYMLAVNHCLEYKKYPADYNLKNYNMLTPIHDIKKKFTCIKKYMQDIMFNLNSLCLLKK